MKKTIKLAVVLSLLSLPVMAKEAIKANTDKCASTEILSREIMKGRQIGANLKGVLDVVGHIESFKLIAIDAYDHPRYSVKKNQDSAVNDFANKWYLACLKANSAK